MVFKRLKIDNQAFVEEIGVVAVTVQFNFTSVKLSTKIESPTKSTEVVRSPDGTLPPIARPQSNDRPLQQSWYNISLFYHKTVKIHLIFFFFCIILVLMYIDKCVLFRKFGWHRSYTRKTSAIVIYFFK